MTRTLEGSLKRIALTQALHALPKSSKDRAHNPKIKGNMDLHCASSQNPTHRL
jgi:hypothetical protein